MLSLKRFRKDWKIQNVVKKYDILLKHWFNMDEAQRQLLSSLVQKGYNLRTTETALSRFWKYRQSSLHLAY